MRDLLTSKGIRLLGWAGMLLLPLTYGAIVAMGIPTAQKVFWTDVLVYLLPLAAAFGCCVFLAWRTLTHLEHWLWGALASGLGCLLLGEAYWTWYALNVDFHGPSLTSPVRLLYVIATLGFLALIGRLSGLFSEAGPVQVTVIADYSALLVTIYALVYALWTLPSFRGLEHSVMGAAVSALFPVIGTAMFVAAVSTVSGWRIKQWRTWERLLAIAYAVYALGLISFGAWYPALLRATVQTVTPQIVIMGSGMYVTFLGALYRMTDANVDVVVPMFRMRDARRGSHLLPAFLAAALPVLVWEARILGRSAEAVPVIVAALILALLLAGRSWVSALDLANLRLRAITDPLTSVYNSTYLRSRLKEVVKWAAEGGYPVAVVVADVDMFRSINNSYGHDAGDNVLCRLASIMNTRGPAGCEVFRLGSDDFIAVLPRTGSKEAVDYAAHVRSAAHRAASPNGTAPVGISLGVAIFPQHAIDAEQLIYAARAAERSTHSSDGPSVRVYDPDSMACQPYEVAREDLRARALRDTVRTLAAAVDARDPDTRNHSVRVSELAMALATKLRLADHRVELVGLAALMHDVGKIGIPDSILLKDGPLLPEERAVVEAHCDLGERILGSANLDDMLPLVRHHHERWDGKGYPDGLSGHDIPLEARILAVCDTYETLISVRPYKAAWDLDAVREELLANSGTQFDPMVMATFISMLAEKYANRPHEVGAGDSAAIVALPSPATQSSTGSS